VKESFINRAKENLADAEAALEAGRYNASANRAYYAAFHAAIEALRFFGYDVTIDHRRVQADFSQYLVHRRKIFATAFKSYLTDLMLVRFDADYKREVSRKEASAQLKKAHEFVTTILNVIENDTNH